MAEWRSVKDFEGLYEVSDEGLVRSVDRMDNLGRRTSGLLLKQRLKYISNPSGVQAVLRVALFRNGKRCDLEVDRLVAEAFIEQPAGCPFVRHKGSSLDNCVSELYWSRNTYGDRYFIRHSKAIEIEREGVRVVAVSGRQAAQRTGLREADICSIRKGASVKGWRLVNWQG